MTSIKYFCKNCKRELEAFQVACPDCGCKNREINISIGETLKIRESTKVRHKRLGFRKFLKEIIQGWFPSKSYQEGVNKSRIIYKENDEYHEVVKEYKTGKVIYEKHEPLSKHRK